MSRIDDKISEIESFIEKLYSFFPQSFEDYKNDEKTKAACEHFFERVIEALADLAFLVLKEKRIESPKDDIDAFVVLCEKGIISKELAERFKDAKGMRNIISHEYGKVDDERVFESVSQELEGDVDEFLGKIRILFLKSSNNNEKYKNNKNLLNGKEGREK